MDAEAAPVDDDQAAELDALRRRAYGPGKGIADDAAALARLNQLEDASRVGRSADAKSPPERVDGDPGSTQESTPSTMRTGSFEASVVASRPEAKIITGAEVGADAVPDAAADAETVAPASEPQRTPWWRLRPVLWSAAALVMIATVVSTIALLVNPPPDALLGRSPVQAGPGTQAFDRGMLDYYGLEESDLVAREQYRGLDAWSAVNERGQRCLFVGWESILWNGTCVPDGLDPIIDLTVDPSMAVDLAELPSGSLVRFTLVGDDVEVRVALADVGA